MFIITSCIEFYDSNIQVERLEQLLNLKEFNNKIVKPAVMTRREFRLLFTFLHQGQNVLLKTTILFVLIASSISWTGSIFGPTGGMVESRLWKTRLHWNSTDPGGSQFVTGFTKKCDLLLKERRTTIED